MTRLPERYPLPRWLAPVPQEIENLALRFVWLVVAINLVGTAFGFWYYLPQFSMTHSAMWPWVPDSPMATLLAASAFAAWRLGRPQEWLTALAFFGNVILGLWTPYTLLLFRGEFGHHPLMWQFLFWSHLAMVLQALVLHRIGDFHPRAVGVALLWYTTDLIVDYHVPVIGDTPHHTVIPVVRSTTLALGATALDAIAAGATVLTLLSTYLALTIHAKKIQTRGARSDAGGAIDRGDR